MGADKVCLSYEHIAAPCAHVRIIKKKEVVSVLEKQAPISKLWFRYSFLEIQPKLGQRFEL